MLICNGSSPFGYYKISIEHNGSITFVTQAYHQETWDPNWNLRTLVMALRGHMLAYPREIGGIQATPEQRKVHALSSQYYSCPHCGMAHNKMLQPISDIELEAVRKESIEMLGTLTRRAFQASKRPLAGDANNLPSLQQGMRQRSRQRGGPVTIILKQMVNFLFPLLMACILLQIYTMRLNFARN